MCLFLTVLPACGWGEVEAGRMPECEAAKRVSKAREAGTGKHKWIAARRCAAARGVIGTPSYL